MYKFDHDWFSQNINNLSHLLNGHKESKINILEIGSFEGRSTVWFLENTACNITCIDTWEGGEDHDKENPEIDFATVKENFDHNTKEFEDRVTIVRGNSFKSLVNLQLFNSMKFDMVYVDGSHKAKDVLADLVLSWPMLNPGALIYCDDYYWGFYKDDLVKFPHLDPTYDSPKLGIDAFVSVYRNKIKPLVGLSNNAAVFVKVAE